MDRAHKREKIFLQPMAGLHIASMIDAEKYEIKIYHESYHGIYDINRPHDADLVFLSGLHKDFDRMRQLSYVFRRHGTMVVAGGNFCTLFPEFAAQFFDAVAAGGIECTLAIMRDFETGGLKSVYRSAQTQVSDYIVKHELLPANGIHTSMHFIEASRGCNFKCDFCVLPAEGATRALYQLDTVIHTIEHAINTAPWFSLSRLYPLIFFIDNNFTNSLPFVEDLCAYLQGNRKIKGWGALITQNILKNHDMVSRMARAKCRVLFTGIESFDNKFLQQHNKKQNAVNVDNIFEDIRFAQKQGIIISYPYMFDPRVSSIAGMKQELERFHDLADLTFPDFFTTVSPLAGTQLFWESMEKGELLENLRLRDLDGQALAFRHVADTQQNYSEFFTLLYTDTLRLFRRRQLLWNLFKNTLKIGLHRPMDMLIFSEFSLNHIKDAAKNTRPVKRNYIGGRDILDPQYHQYPKGISVSDKEKYFSPIQVTDDEGAMSAWLKPYRPVL